MSPLDSKQALRMTTRAARRGLTDDERRERSSIAAANLLSLQELRTADTVLLYAAMPEECNPWDAWKSLVAADVRVLFPRVEDHGLVLASADDLTGLRPGHLGILEPVGAPTPPWEVDVAVVPGLAFDRLGGRLGMGGGHYDRLLPELRPDCLRVGLAFACQIAVRVPREDHDEGVDVVVTEAAVHRMRQPPPDSA